MIRHLLLLMMVAALRPMGAWAQQNEYKQAYEKFEAGDLEAARVLIDAAVSMPDAKNTPGPWLLRGFIYKDLFKQAGNPAAADSLRDTALNSLSHCLNKDTAGQYSKDARQAVDYLAKSYYNDAAKALNASDPERAMQLFAKYKEVTTRIDPNFNATAREIEFSNALGTVYAKRYNQDRLDTTWFDKAVRTYKAVIELDASNYGANYNLATLYYNRGVYNIQRISPDNNIPDLQDIQSVSRDYFNKALPYMLKAHELNPGRKETLLGLEGIYYSLQQNQESDRFRKLYESLEPDDRH